MDEPLDTPITIQDLRPDAFPALVEQLDPVIVEVGANDGRDTARFLAAYPRATITIFEPDPRPLRRFWRNVPRGRVELIAAAVADYDGFAPWFASGGKPPRTDGDWAPEANADWDLSGSILQPTGHLQYSPWVTFRMTVVVPVVRLDTWLAGKPPDYRIDILWADVQGAEALLIRGATETLKRTRFFYTEFSDNAMYAGQPTRRQILELLPDWRLHSIHGHNLLLENGAWTR